VGVIASLYKLFRALNDCQNLHIIAAVVTGEDASAKLPCMTRDTRQKNARSVERIAAQDGGALFGLLKQARLHQKLDQLLKSELDSQMAEHCQVACVRNGRLLIFTPTPVWRTRLVLLSSGLLSRLRNKGYPGLTGIDVKVSPLLSDVDEIKKPKTLSPAAKKSLSRFAAACPDETLQAIAKRMAETE